MNESKLLIKVLTQRKKFSFSFVCAFFSPGRAQHKVVVFHFEYILRLKKPQFNEQKTGMIKIDFRFFFNINRRFCLALR